MDLMLSEFGKPAYEIQPGRLMYRQKLSRPFESPANVRIEIP
jgi:hypothetical protein